MAYSHLLDSIPDSIALFTKYSYKTRTSILNLNGRCATILAQIPYLILANIQFAMESNSVYVKSYGMYVSHIDRLMVPGRPSSHGWKRKPILYLPSANEVWGKLMFSQVFDCTQGEGGWLPSMHHVT